MKEVKQFSIDVSFPLRNSLTRKIGASKLMNVQGIKHDENHKDESRIGETLVG